MNLKEQREAAFKAAEALIEKVKAGDESAVPEAEAKIAEVKALNEKMERAAEGDALIAQIKSMGAPDGRDATKRLDFKGFGSQIAASMHRTSEDMGRKSLVASGESIAPLPVTYEELTREATRRPTRLAEAIPLAQREESIYAFVRSASVSEPGGAGVVAPGNLKPRRALALEREESRLRVVAVLSDPIDKYLLADRSNVGTWVEQQLAAALADELENQVLAGDGTGENFTGIANTSGIQTQAYATDPLITVQAGISKLLADGVSPAFVGLSPADWLSIQTTRNASGNFDVGGPIDATAQRLWGVPVVVAPGVTDGEGYVIGEQSVVLSTDQSGVHVEWGTSSDMFERNQLMARVEGRFNLDVTLLAAS